MIDDENLQGQSEVENQEQTTDVEQSNGTPQETEDNTQKPEFVLGKDGSLQWNVDDESEPQGEESDEEEEPYDDDTDESETSPADEHYMVKIDGKDVDVTLEELTRGYMRQSDYTRKTQELAEQRRRTQTPPQNQQQYSNPVAGQAQSTPDLNALAKQIASRNLGLESPDDLSELDFNHISAFVEAKQSLLNQQNHMITRANAIQNLEAQLRSEDPAYEDIMKGAQTRMENLPYKQFKALQDAYEQGNPEPLRAFYHDVLQKEHYASAIKKADGSKRTVPKVVPAGITPVEKSKSNKKVDFTKLGSMSRDQQAKVLIDMGFI